jgi:hypothetical protein
MSSAIGCLTKRVQHAVDTQFVSEPQSPDDSGAALGSPTARWCGVAGINDTPESVAGVTDYLAEIGPATADLAAPTRPPAERDTAPPDETILLRPTRRWRNDTLELLHIAESRAGDLGVPKVQACHRAARLNSMPAPPPPALTSALSAV